jgi:hypothetical protein
MSPFRHGEPSETCPQCNNVLEINDTKWTRKDEKTWQLVRDTYCPECKLSGTLVLRTLIQN